MEMDSMEIGEDLDLVFSFFLLVASSFFRQFTRRSIVLQFQFFEHLRLRRGKSREREKETFH